MRVNRKIREKMKELGLASIAAAARDCGLSKQTFHNFAVLGREPIPAHQRMIDAWLGKVPDPSDTRTTEQGGAA